MGFKAGVPRPANAGRKKGSKNKKTILKIEDFVIQNDINISKEIWDTIQLISDPIQKFKALIDFYKFIEAPQKEKESDLTLNGNQPANQVSIIVKPTGDNSNE